MKRRSTRCIVVLGMHRSGTSALAGALGLMGVALGRRLLPATSFNSRGYFEHEEVFRFHERLLDAIGRTWDDLRPLPERWWRADALKPLRLDLRNLLEREFAGVALWGVKDPRLCRLLPFWREPLRQLGVQPGFVIVTRPPREVAGSLAARDGFPDWKSELLYLEHMIQAERATRRDRRCIVTYDQLLKEGAATLRRVGQVLGAPLADEGAAAAVAEFLSPSLRHHRAGARRTGASEPSRGAEACYRALAAGAAGSERAMIAALDKLAAAVPRIRLPWESLAAELTSHADDVRAELESSRRAVQILAREIEEARQAHGGRDRVEAELRAALAAREEEVDRARAHIDARGEEIDAARRAHEARDAMEAELRRALEERVAEVNAARTYIDALARENEAARRAHEARDAMELDLRRALQDRLAEVDAARTHIDGLVQEIEAARTHIDALVQENEAARRAHEHRDAVEAALRGEIEAQRQEVEAVRTRLAAVGEELAALRRSGEQRDVLEDELSRAAQVRLERIERERADREAAERALRAELAQAQQDLATARHELSETRSELEWSLLEAEGELADQKRSLQDLASRRWSKRPPRPLPLVSAVPPVPFASAADTVLGALDPLPAELEPGEHAITGWAAARPGTRLLRVVLRTGRTLIEAERGLPRPDVERAYPTLTGAGVSGFRIAAHIGPGSHRLAVKVEDDREHWHLLAAPEVRVRRPPLSAALDRPRSPYVRSGAVHVAGWCCHPQERVRRLSLEFGGRLVPCTYGLPRADVEAHYPDHPGSGESGFDVTCRLPPGRGRIGLRAQLASGDVLVHTFPDVITVLPALLEAPVGRAATLAARGAGWARLGTQLWRRYREGRPLPPLRRLPGRLRDAARLHRARETARASGPAVVIEGQEPTDAYIAWLRVNGWHDRAHAVLVHALSAHSASVPRVSVLVAAPIGGDLDRVLASLREQVYADWELCVAADAGEPGTCARLEALRAADHRVHFTCGAGHGDRVTALNAAAALSSGELVLALDPRSGLAPEALAEVALAAANPRTEVVYWDHDVRDERGVRTAPSFKPGWSPALLLARNYIGRSWAARRRLFQEVGGLRDEARGAVDYDFLLRATERARQVEHLPLVLQHDDSAAEPESPEPARQAVEAALRRRGSCARPVPSGWAAADGHPVFTHDFSDSGPTVAVIVAGPRPPAGTDGLRGTRYNDHEVVELDGNDGSRINEAARRATAQYVLFLDPGAQVREPGWLSQMMGHAQMPGVGAVGARITGPDGRTAHAGFSVGGDRGRVRPLLLVGEEDGGPADGRLCADRWAVGGGCLLTPRAVFEALGGFDETLGSPRYRELDYCRRLAAAGHRSVYAPGAGLALASDIEQELAAAPAEEASFRRRHLVVEDAHRSPHLTVSAGRLALQPRRLARHLDRPIRALMCSFNLNREGAAYSQYELTSWLKETGVLDPVVFCPEDGPLHQAYEGRGIEVRIARHPLSGVFEEAGYARAIASFATRIHDTGAELVYGNTAHTFYAIAAAEAAGVASVWNPRESEPPEQHFRHFGPVVTARALECFRYPYRVVFVAEATREVYRALDTERNFTTVHNGLDLARLEREAARWTRERARRSLDVGDEDVVLLVLGTVCERKGQADLPAALGSLPERLWPRVRCLVVGDRGLPYSRRVEAARAGLPARLRERVAFLPETDDPSRFYRAADVFVCTSRVESFPRVTLEAMAHGLALVTTPVFGIREQVREGVNALLYEPGDTAGLGDALARLVGDDALRARMAAQARPVLECLNDFHGMSNAYAQIFREASLSRGRPRAAAVSPP